MAAPTFVGTLFDGVLLKQFVVTAFGDDQVNELAVAFDGVAGRPTEFDTEKLLEVPVPGSGVYLFVSSLNRRDTALAASGTSEWGIRAVTSTGCVITKLTPTVPAGNHVAQELVVTIDARHSIGR